MKNRTLVSRLAGCSFVGMTFLLCAALLFAACSRDSSNDTPVVAAAGTPIPMSGAHVAITLRDVDGNPIDLASGTAPYSPKQTCGYCHNYSTIGQGFHFQQGADELDDDYGTNNNTYAWVSSPGMTGKW